MIITVTMNPAIDKTVKIKNINIGGLNRLEVQKKEIGGKGLNVAKTVSKLGYPVLPITFMSTSDKQQIEKTLSTVFSDYQTVTIDQPIRTNMKVLTEDNRITEFNEPGPIVSPKELEEIKNKIIGRINQGDILVLSGSVPGGVSRDLYYELIKVAHDKQVKVILDADDELMSYGIKAIPEAIKPNRYELEKLYEIPNASLEQLVNVAEKIINQGIKYVVISLGEEGALFANSEEILHVEVLNFTPISTVGAGDAMVGALAVGIQENYTIRQLAAICTATAAISCGIPVASDSYNTNITNLSNKVTIRKIR